MAMLGFIGLSVAFAASFAAVFLLAFSAYSRAKAPVRTDAFARIGRLFACIAFVALSVCCAAIVICFATGDISMQYVVEYRSDSSSPLAPLYLLSGLWAGRQGSLLFWAWLISAFNCFVAVRFGRESTVVDDVALVVSNAVLLAFLGVLLISESNMPFALLPASYIDVNGNLTGGAELYGLNPLLEHWAMAIHPPTLFVGYAGLTVPFSYALAAMICGDDSALWVERVNGITAFSWLFLGIGIGLGAVWAYVVLGWGGYWGWDPVENASLLSWLACVALMHSFTLYRRRGMFKRWSVVAASFSFMFVIVGTFISRSGLVQSVHAFAGDSVSLVLFLGLIVAAFAAGLFGALGRPRTFGVRKDAAEEQDGGFVTREMAYYLNNVLMMVGAFLLAYLTVSSALPEWMPLGGQSLTAGTYNAIARPLGIALALLIAVCPMLGWRKTDPRQFARDAAVPAVFAAVLFAALMVYFVQALLPAYYTTLSSGTTAAEDLATLGPEWYYNGLAVVGMAAGCLLVFNSLFMLFRFLRKAFGGQRGTDRVHRQAGKGEQPQAGAVFERLRANASSIGGFVAHLGMGVILIGLIGSSMYVTEVTGYLAGGRESQAQTSFQIQDYAVSAVDSYGHEAGGDGYVYTLDLAVEKGGERVGVLQPSIQVDPTTMQRKYEAAVVSYPLYDLFAVYRGLNAADDYSVDIRINPLISLVWTGFVLLMVGTAFGLLAKRGSVRRPEAAAAAAPCPRSEGEPEEAEA